ncbi:patatin-like phospholipase family protein [Hyphomicrobium sp.]|uniref:patatin-like phospholipase family protein n=1 Tax=Hyphomicrobium sp. TaxID=82 RepID=UPI0025BD2515|nr:patatin-like phospholipase family protein [Hyphomicrobium sp.]
MNLALQGGGAHGAFTWGVLDRLLEDDELEINWVSATSAGAVNAVAVASGLSEGGKTSARNKLRSVWEAVHKAGVPDLLRLNPFLYGLTRTPHLAQMASLWSPYEFNPLGFDPLRRLLSESIDFAKLRQNSPIELLIAATEVATGRSRIFRRHELTVEAVLASSCLPTLHHAVEIDGVAYWDGGFSANPDIKTLAMESPVEDTLIVQLNPLVRPGLPTGVREISLHANRLAFNAPLIREVELIETVRECQQGRIGGPRGRFSKLATHRFHLIEAGRYTSALSPDSNMKPDWTLLSYLFSAGRDEADKWLGRHRSAIGRRSSVDLKERFLTHRRVGGSAGEDRGAGKAKAPVAADIPD